MDPAVGPVEPARVHAVGRQQDVARHGDVGSREPQLGAGPVAAGDDTPHLVVTTEQGVGRVEVALDQRVADPRGRDLDAVASRPRERNSPTLPARRWPKWKSAPTTTSLALRQSTSTSRTNSSAGSLLRASSKVTTRQ